MAHKKYWLPEGGAAGALVRETDWSKTPLGPMDQWPAVLRFAVTTLLEAHFPTLLRWGPQFIQIYNDAYIPLLEGRHPKAMGQSTQECWPDAWPVIQPLLTKALQTGKATALDDRPIELDSRGDAPGRTRYFTISYSPVRLEDGTVGGLLCTLIETTDRHRFEQGLREADRRKDEFLATLAHELRNPLAPMRNGLHIMSIAGLSNPSQRRAYEVMDRQLSHMVRLVDDLLDVSRITRGKLELRKERVTLASVIDSAIETTLPLIEAARHELTIDIGQAPVELDADPVRLAQVFSNLLSNSTKYTSAGGHISLTAVLADGGVEVRVQDDGSGIPQDVLPYIFNMFSQADRLRERVSGGLGIGLALTKGLVEMHGGHARAESRGAGEGSTFIIWLPIAKALAKPASVAQSITPAAPARKTRKRVLVVDDNEDAAQSMASLLGMLGHEVHVVHDGRQALNIVRSFDPDLILMDIGMPYMNGLEASRQIRALDVERQPIIVALTGWGQDVDRDRSRQAGIDHHLVKPVDLDVLESLLESDVLHGR